MNRHQIVTVLSAGKSFTGLAIIKTQERANAVLRTHCTFGINYEHLKKVEAEADAKGLGKPYVILVANFMRPPQLLCASFFALGAGDMSRLRRGNLDGEWMWELPVRDWHVLRQEGEGYSFTDLGPLSSLYEFKTPEAGDLVMPLQPILRIAEPQHKETDGGVAG